MNLPMSQMKLSLVQKLLITLLLVTLEWCLNCSFVCVQMIFCFNSKLSVPLRWWRRGGAAVTTVTLQHEGLWSLYLHVFPLDAFDTESVWHKIGGPYEMSPFVAIFSTAVKNVKVKSFGYVFPPWVRTSWFLLQHISIKLRGPAGPFKLKVLKPLFSTNAVSKCTQKTEQRVVSYSINSIWPPVSSTT